MSPADESLRIKLCLRHDTESVEGTCHEVERGVSTTFSGWLELISALETARRSARGPNEPAAEPGRHSETKPARQAGGVRSTAEADAAHGEGPTARCSLLVVDPPHAPSSPR